MHAAALGADAVELDARRTADGIVVVHHDAFVSGRPLIDMRRSEVAAEAPWIPDLTDALAACSPMWVDIEIKNHPDEPDWDPDDAVLRAITPLLGSHTVITSFNPMTAQRAQEAGARTGLLLGWGDEPDEVVAEWPGYEFVLPSKEMVSVAAAHTLVAAAHAAGAAVGIWTIDDPDLIRAYASAGVDLVFTNVPDVAVEALTR